MVNPLFLAAGKFLRNQNIAVAIMTLILTTISVYVSFFFASPYILLIIPLIAIVTITAIILFKQPILAFFVFIIALPIHSLIITILISHLGISISIARFLASWKESLLIFIFSIMILRIMLSKQNIYIAWIDLIAYVWFSQIIIYFIFQNTILNLQSSLVFRAYGARDWMLYLIPYFIGRLIFISERQSKRIFKLIMLVGVFTSLVGIIEYFLIPLEWHVRLGIPKYFSEFLGVQYPDVLFGLPPNYWTRMGTWLVRRSVSVYLSGQAFALPFLIIMPIVVYNCFFSKSMKYSRVALFLCSIALILTITRMTIIVCFIQSVLLLWMLRRKTIAISLLSISIVICVIALLFSTTFRSFVVNTLTFQDSSTQTRPRQWVEGLQSLADNPFGLGLGSTGQTATRFGLDGVGTEAGYLKITGALGLPGLLLFLGWFMGILVYSFVGYKMMVGHWRGVAAVTLVASIGFLLNNFTAPPDQSTFTIYIFCWFAGVTIQQVILQSRKADSDPSIVAKSEILSLNMGQP
jgi:hypothetical protein